MTYVTLIGTGRSKNHGDCWDSSGRPYQKLDIPGIGIDVLTSALSTQDIIGGSTTAGSPKNPVVSGCG